MWDWVVRALGVFWFAGGMVTLRALGVSRVIDAAISAIRGRRTTRDLVRSSLLALGAVLTALAGFLLAALDRFALATLLANAVVQAIWLVYAARHFPPEDADDRAGRAQTRNAFLFWLAGSAAVIAAERAGAVQFAALPMVEVVAGVAALTALVWQGREIVRMHRTPSLGPMDDGEVDAGEERPFVQPKGVVLAPEVGCWPMWDADDGRNLDPWCLEISEDLAARLADFDGRVIDALDVDHDDGPTIVDPEVRRRLEAEAIEITRALAAVYGADAVAWKLPGEG